MPLFKMVSMSRLKPGLSIVGILGCMALEGCSAIPWNQQSDSCVRESLLPPLRRVVNYADPNLCHRPLKPREEIPSPLRTSPSSK